MAPTDRDSRPDLHAYGDGAEAAPVALPADLEWVSLTSEEAERHAGLLMLRGDLDFAISVLSRLIEASAAGELDRRDRAADRDDHRARWNAALVAYARAFGTRVGDRLDAGLHQGNAAERHSYFMALRNRHIAHSVSEYERASVYVGFSADTNSPVFELAEVFTTEETPSRSGVGELLDLTLAARTHLEGALEADRRRLIDYARSNATTLRSRPRVTATPANAYGRDVGARKTGPRRRRGR